MGYGLGVDLGTTWTAAAVVRDGRAEIVSLGDRAPSVPSVLLIRDDGSVLVGEAAVRRGLSEPDRVAREFKRRVGDTTPLILGGTPWSAEALMARLLRWVVDQVTAREGGPPDAVVVTHPANWGGYKTDLLAQALRQADLPDGVLLSEPEAAARFYATQERVEPGSVVAVYDLGGGTFDATVLRKTDTGFEVLGRPDGIDRMGGIDIDAAVYAHLVRSLGPAFDDLDVDDPAVLGAVAHLREECVDAKEALSHDTDATIRVLLPGITTEVRLTRAELESMIRPSLADTVSTLRRSITGAGLGPDDVSRVLLVGGSSRIPLVAQLVSADLARPVAIDAHPKFAVALGAALAADPEATSGSATVVAPVDVEAPPTEPVAKDKPPPTEPVARDDPPRAVPVADPERPAPADEAVEPAVPEAPVPAAAHPDGSTSLGNVAEGDLPPSTPTATDPVPAKAAVRPAWLDPDQPEPLDAGAPPSAPGRGRWVIAAVAAVAVLLIGGVAIANRVTDDSSTDTGDGADTISTATTRTDVADFQVTEIGVGAYPSGVAVGEGAVWVVDSDSRSGSVSRIDPATSTVISTVDVGGFPWAVAVGEGSVWVADQVGGTVSRIDPGTDTVTANVAVGGGGAQSVAVGDGAVWGLNGLRILNRIDPATNAVTATIDVGTDGPARAVGVAVGEGAVWVAVGGGGAPGILNRIDPATNAVADTIDLGSSVPSALAVGEGAVWVTNQKDGTVLRIDPATNAVTDTIDVGIEPHGVAVGEGAVWVTSFLDKVSRIDPATNAVTDTIDVGIEPSAVAVGEGAVWVANSGDGTVSRIE